MTVKIDTDKLTANIDGKEYQLVEAEEVKRTSLGLADMMLKHQGEKEYDGTVAEIQKWYYGYVARMPWCATCISYFMDRLGKLSAIGGKNENVCLMMNACKQAAVNGYGTFIPGAPDTFRKDDIIFLLWGDTVMKVGSNKHVCVAADDSTGNTIPCIGGNQNDMICIKNYDRSAVYAVYRVR